MKIHAKLLIVDDRPANLIALRAALSGCDCELIEALSGPEAVAHALEHDFAAILLDVQMPGMDGFEVARQIRGGARNRSAPIIFLTAIEREEKYVQMGYTVGAVDYLSKPLNVDILKSKVGVFLDLYRKNLENLHQAELLKEAALREQENLFLKRALKIRDDFLSMAAHELSTPITPLNLQIQSFLQMYKDGTFSSAPPEVILRLLQTSEAQVKRLSRLIEDLVDVSRIKAGRVRIKRESVELTQLVRGVLDTFRLEIENAGCEISLESDGEIFGFWDPLRVEQVAINLLKNSLKYGAGKPIQLKLSAEGGEAFLIVRDHGIGIAEEDQGRIFSRFERAVSARNYGGLGLGLFITNQIVKLHGGDISVRSQADQGAEFTVRLPVATS